ncbi:hypothetical protein SAY87_000140 [Trapa incisa]|uniref:Uncharacterized protein n=1 Tax=Trapa incisa TaxID=236973 RepID=A0AAN7GR74_9MYRT|nr:hypothetical protein SAY87_000140 [Trapa incisa]
MGATWRKMDPHVAPAIGRKRVEFKDDKSPSRDKNELRLLPASYFTLESLFLLPLLSIEEFFCWHLESILDKMASLQATFCARLFKSTMRKMLTARKSGYLEP